MQLAKLLEGKHCGCPSLATLSFTIGHGSCAHEKLKSLTIRSLGLFHLWEICKFHRIFNYKVLLFNTLSNYTREAWFHMVTYYATEHSQGKVKVHDKTL